LDIATSSGRVILKRLLAKADVLIESHAPGYLASLGLGYEDLQGELPDLIYCSITPFGQTGPYRDYQANDIALMALSGLMYVSGDPDREPSDRRLPAGYFAAVNVSGFWQRWPWERRRRPVHRRIDAESLAAPTSTTRACTLHGAIRCLLPRHLFLPDGHLRLPRWAHHRRPGTQGSRRHGAPR
jgi:hypothetical protein